MGADSVAEEIAHVGRVFHRPQDLLPLAELALELQPKNGLGEVFAVLRPAVFVRKAAAESSDQRGQLGLDQPIADAGVGRVANVERLRPVIFDRFMHEQRPVRLRDEPFAAALKVQTVGRGLGVRRLLLIVQIERDNADFGLANGIETESEIECLGVAFGTVQSKVEAAVPELERLPSALTSHLEPGARASERKRVQEAVDARLEELRRIAVVDVGEPRRVGWAAVTAAGAPPSWAWSARP